MSKMSKTIAALGVVAGLGVAALPLSTYAANTADVTLNAQVSDSIELSTTTPTLTVKPVNGGSVASAVANLQVATNNSKGYKLVAKAVDSANLVSAESATIAPGQPVDNTTTSYWGIMGGDMTVYTGLSATTAKPVKTTTTAPEEGTDEIDVTFGVATAAGQAAGTYTGKVTFTATANI